MLVLRDVDVCYGQAQALSGVSLDVGQGEIVALVGANGAGKTTTLRAIAGLCPIAGGTIRFDGACLVAVASSARAGLGIALVPEGRELWPRMTVRENLDLGAYGPRARALRGESLERVFALFPRLEQRARQLAGSMSGGEQQMVAIGRALMTRPRLLLCDEPSLGLAPLVTAQVFDTIRRLHADGLTILLVEQNLTAALEVADRGYVLETGRVVHQGPSRELLDDHRIRATYLGL